MTNFHTYKKYRLPITLNPLNYGKLIFHFKEINVFIMFINIRNLALITQNDLFNEVKIYTQGELTFNYKDHKIDDNTFIRSIDANRYTFKDNKLIEINKLIVQLMLIILMLLLFINIIDSSTIFNTSLICSTNIIKFNNKLNWTDFNIEIKNTNFSSKLLKSKLDIFWNEIMETKLSENHHIWLLFRLQWSNNNYVTIGKLVKLNKEDKDYLFNYIIRNMDDKSEYYTEQLIKSMIFSYTIKKGKAKDKINFESSNLSYQYYYHHKLPITMNPLEYGLLIEQTGNKFTIQVNKTDVAIINQDALENHVKFFKEGVLTYEYRDFKLSHNSFVRTLENKKFTFINNKIVLLTVDKKVNFIKNLLPLSQLNNKIITMDIETFIKDGIHIPYCISWYDGDKSRSYYILDLKSSNDMLTQAVKDIMIKKYDNFNIYIHNLARFDGIFLLKILAKLGNVKPIIHHGDLISIGFKFNNYNITFKDSQQLLILSLRKLGQAFGVDVQKGYFPYKFVNENNLDYIGVTPDFSLFDNISHDEYDGITSYNWNLRDEAIKYCEIDCISLYQIIIKFSNMIFDIFKINIHKYPTLSSLAFAIFRTHFLRKDEIPQLSGHIDRDIRQGYTGGSVDVYIPQNKEGTKIWVYDVNSLYPYVMDQFDMPVGKPIYFEGNIREIDKDAFGFFYCKITAPDNLKHPIVQTHVKVNNMIRTMAPLGTWNDMIFSAEMDNAMKNGYQFEILWGYKFNRKNIFKGYVGVLYKLRIQYPTGHPLNLIAKLLLNSLYGRFGMIDSFLDIKIFDNFKEFKKWYDSNNESVVDFFELGDKILVQYRFESKNQQTALYGNLETHNVSIGIAAAITAYARIHMSQFKNNPNFELFYTDTDSIYIDRPLADHMISNKVLGKMKLENVLRKAIFLAPKVYCLQTEEGKVIYKVKGLKHEVELTMEDFEQLLYKDSFLKKLQNKWVKNLSDGDIKIIDHLYTLKITCNKRKLIYDSNNKFINTVPFIINDAIEIIK